jgi:fibronectin type 3 domain-containing protein
VSLAVSPNGKVISLFFPANPERDILGYRVFRSTAETLPFDKWQKLTDEILTRTTYRDDKVEAGRKYFYYVVAVDSAGNVSPPSGVVSEIVPQ